MTNETRADKTGRRLAMLAGQGAFRLPTGSPDTSGASLKPHDVAHAMSWIRGRRRRFLQLGEHEELPEDEERECRLTELLLYVMYVNPGQQGQDMGHLFLHLVDRALELTQLDRRDKEYPIAPRMAALAIRELTEPRLCTECHGQCQIPEWRRQQLEHKVADHTKQRPTTCPTCGGHGVQPRSDWKRYNQLKVHHQTYRKRWRHVYEELLGLCLVRVRDGLDAVCAALVREAG